jgi:hypothetical protein
MVANLRPEVTMLASRSLVRLRSPGEESVGKRVGMKTVIHVVDHERHRIDLYFTCPGKKETLAVRALYTRTAS